MALIVFDDLRNFEFGWHRDEPDEVDRRLYSILDFIRFNLVRELPISLLQAQATALGEASNMRLRSK